MLGDWKAEAKANGEAVWRIRVEGIGNYSRCRSTKRKTMSKIGTKESVENYANQLKVYGGYKIIWIKKWQEL